MLPDWVLYRADKIIVNIEAADRLERQKGLK